MARPIYKELTREMLEKWGITSLKYNEESKSWEITRYWFKNNSKVKHNIILKVSTAVRKHKYTNDKAYQIVSFAYNQQHISLPLARIVYAWCSKEKKVPEGFVVDHKDNDPFNNYFNEANPDDPRNNLQLLTQEQNLIKRFVDNPSNSVNQWAKLNKVKYAVAHKCFVEGKSYDEAVVEVEKIFGRE